MAAETIDELKSAGLSGTRLAELAKSCGAESGKLSELALIFQGYETLLFRSGMDPADRLRSWPVPASRGAGGGEVPGFLRGGKCSSTSSIPSTRPKSGCWGPCWPRCPA